MSIEVAEATVQRTLGFGRNGRERGAGGRDASGRGIAKCAGMDHLGSSWAAHGRASRPPRDASRSRLQGFGAATALGVDHPTSCPPQKTQHQRPGERCISCR